jgi:hypothetical protein
LLLAGSIVLKFLMPPPASIPANGSYSYNSPWIPVRPFLIGALLVFGAASYWAFRRITKSNRIT